MSEIDELAYRLYIDHVIKYSTKFDGSNPIEVKEYMSFNYENNYKKAKNIIRKEKLKKLNENRR
jgi:hypothetical protein